MFTIFAATSILDGGRTRLYAAGFFYVCTLQAIYGSEPPCWSVNAPTAVKVLVNGKGGTVFYSAHKNNFICMTSTEKTCLTVNNSSLTSTPDCESVNTREKPFDFSEFSNYLTKVSPPDQLVSDLEELRLDYLKMALFIASQDNYPNDLLLSKRRIERINYLDDIGSLIDLFKNLQSQTLSR